MNGKGSRPRNCFSKQYRDNYDYIFRKPVEAKRKQDQERTEQERKWYCTRCDTDNPANCIC